MKFFVFFALTFALFLHLILAAPHIPKTEQELSKSFIEFLEQDKELSKLLDRQNLGDGAIFSRQRRQAEEDSMSEVDQTVDTGKPEGFFDRAAKFVMEVLQRFLKWINTDD